MEYSLKLINTEIDRLETRIKNNQDYLEDHVQSITSIQQNIDQCEDLIDELNKLLSLINSTEGEK